MKENLLGAGMVLLSVAIVASFLKSILSVDSERKKPAH